MTIIETFKGGPGRRRRAALLVAAGAAGLGLAGVGAWALADAVAPAGRHDDALMAKLAKAFPNTRIGSVHCGAIDGLCEATAGRNVFYADPSGRYVFVGSILDLKDKVDLTDRRQKELAQIDQVADRISGDGAVAPAAPSAPHAGAPGAPPVALAPIRIDLPLANAVVHHKGAPLKIAAITDLNCAYCRMLMESLKAAPDIELTEYPVQLLRPDSLDKAKLVLCAGDREGAANSLYFGGDVKTPGNCAKWEAAVRANTAFARAHGVTGTPTLVRADGAAVPGYMPTDQLRAWIKAAAPRAG